MDYLGLLQDTNYNLASSRIKGVSKPGERFDPYPDVSSEKIRARSNRRERRRFFPLFLFLAALMLVATSTASAQGPKLLPGSLRPPRCRICMRQPSTPRSHCCPIRW